MADKIDQLTIGNNSYDIDLPPDATPSIASLTTSGNVQIGGNLTDGTNSISVANIVAKQNALPTTSTAGKVLTSTSTSGTTAWSSWSSAGFLKTNSSGVVSVDTNSYLTTTGKAADADKLDGYDSSYFLNYGSTSQAKSGNMTFTGNLYVGDGVSASRAVDDEPYKTKFLDFQGRTGVIKHLNAFSGVGDWFYCADLKSNFTVRSTFQGSGTDSDTYNANYYTLGVDSGLYLKYLFDWNLSQGWSVLPSKVSTSTPAIIEVKSSTQMTYTDVLKLVLTGHTGYEAASDYSGILNNYKIEVCTDYTNDTWVTVVNRSGVTDKIGECPQFSLQTSSYTACYGIRLTIYECSVTGSGYSYIKITSMQLRDHRPDFTVPESVGALSLRGGDVYGDITLNSKGNGVIFQYPGRSDYMKMYAPSWGGLRINTNTGFTIFQVYRSNNECYFGPGSDNSTDIGNYNGWWRNMFIKGIINPNGSAGNPGYGIALPSTTGWTENKTLGLAIDIIDLT